MLVCTYYICNVSIESKNVDSWTVEVLFAMLDSFALRHNLWAGDVFLLMCDTQTIQFLFLTQSQTHLIRVWGEIWGVKTIRHTLIYLFSLRFGCHFWVICVKLMKWRPATNLIPMRLINCTVRDSLLTTRIAVSLLSASGIGLIGEAATSWSSLKLFDVFCEIIAWR